MKNNSDSENDDDNDDNGNDNYDDNGCLNRITTWQWDTKNIM
jgi:hypothetical protein